MVQVYPEAERSSLKTGSARRKGRGGATEDDAQMHSHARSTPVCRSSPRPLDMPDALAPQPTSGVDWNSLAHESHRALQQ